MRLRSKSLIMLSCDAFMLRCFGLDLLLDYILDNVVLKDLQPDLTRDIKRSSLLLAPPDLCYVLLMDGGLLASTCACIKVNLDAFVSEPSAAGFGFIFVIMRVSFLLQLLFPLSRCWPL